MQQQIRSMIPQVPLPARLGGDGDAAAVPRASASASDTAHFGASRAAREFRSWNPAAGSADADLLGELGTLRSRARDLARNHGIASGAFQTLVDNVVGTGLTLQPNPNWRLLGWSKEQADEWSEQVEAEWQTFAERDTFDAARTLDFAGMTALVFRSVMTNGDSVVLPLWLSERRGSRWATALQMIEADRVCNPQNGMDTERLRGGFEVDPATGEKIACHIRRTHPGDVYGLGLMGAPAEWRRVEMRLPFGRRRVIHIHDQERTGQTRGKPILAPVMAGFKMHDHYQRSEMQAAIVNAMVAAFIETPLDNDTLGELLGTGDGGLSGQRRVDQYMANSGAMDIRLEGGSIIPLYPGNKLTPFTPARPNSAFGPFVENVLRHISAGMNMPYELLLKDFSKTNYSSARAALLEAWRYFTGRRTWLAKYWAQPVYELWLEEAVNAGRIQAPDYYANQHAYCRARWIGPGRGWIDPVKEAEAAGLRVRNNLSTLQAECAEQGQDWRDVLEQKAREKRELERLGLTEADVTTFMMQRPAAPAEQPED